MSFANMTDTTDGSWLHSNATAGGVGDGSSFHQYPESKWTSLVQVMAPISLLGLFLFGTLHFMRNPCLYTSLGSIPGVGPRRAGRARLGKVIVCVALIYVLPTIFFIGGASDDDNTFALVGVSIFIEVVINLFLFKKSQRQQYSKLGLRTLFVSMCILIGAGIATDRYNDIDYYGPVRVTGAGLEYYRPQQDVDVADPKFFYYYQLDQTLEWGDSWACLENQSAWCSVTEDGLWKDKCRVRINCRGRPETFGSKGECATEKQKLEAYGDLIKCWAETAGEEGLDVFHDFDGNNFTRSVAPWDDASNPHSVTRSVTCGYRKECSAAETPPPEALMSKALWYWVSGGSLALAGCIILALGISSGEAKGFAWIVAQQVPAEEPLDDLELASSLPVVEAVRV